ncbi:MAG: DUF1566 domain-containing protein [Tatlockia sp.]|nr:DUF1566 domain-containing protein [Tatlockia sp.]
MKKIVVFILLSLGLMSPLHADKIADLEKNFENIQIAIKKLQVEMELLLLSGLPYKPGKGIGIINGLIQTTTQHHVGELYQGGIVFFVDETGQHGLVASKRDVHQGEGISWRNGESGNRVTNARSDGIGAGENNTRLIIAQQTLDANKGKFAALLASNYHVLSDGETPCPTVFNSSLVCYGNWYLPSAFELQLLFNNLRQANLAAFDPEFYWSSTEVNVTNAWLINFGTGELIASNKSNTVGRVRAISHF